MGTRPRTPGEPTVVFRGKASNYLMYDTAPGFGPGWRQLQDEALSLGFSRIGVFGFSAFNPSIRMEAFSREGTVLSIMGIDRGGPLMVEAFELVTNLEGDASVTTTTNPIAISQAERGIHKPVVHACQGVAHLAREHEQWIGKLGKARKETIVTPLELARMVDAFLVREGH